MIEHNSYTKFNTRSRRLTSDELDSVIDESDWPNVIRRHQSFLERIHFFDIVISQANIEPIQAESCIQNNSIMFQLNDHTNKNIDNIEGSYSKL